MTAKARQMYAIPVGCLLIALGALLAFAGSAAASDPPANDNFADAQTLNDLVHFPSLPDGSPSGKATATNAYATVEDGEPAQVPAGRGKKSDISGMKLTPDGGGLPTAILNGMWQGTPFVVTLTGGGKGKTPQDTLQVTYPGFPTDVVKAAHSDVHIQYH